MHQLILSALRDLDSSDLRVLVRDGSAEESEAARAVLNGRPVCDSWEHSWGDREMGVLDRGEAMGWND